MSYRDTVATLKHNIAKLTGVQPKRQKPLNPKHKGMLQSELKSIYVLFVKLILKIQNKMS